MQPRRPRSPWFGFGARICLYVAVAGFVVWEVTGTWVWEWEEPPLPQPARCEHEGFEAIADRLGEGDYGFPRRCDEESPRD